MLHIDGSQGGGSILRTAAAIAVADRLPIRITNIRKNRSTPGLRPQHLAGLQILTEITGSHLDGGYVGSLEIEIEPNKQIKDRVTVNLRTAASVSLIFQLLSNYCAVSKTKITLEFEGGGTHTKWSPNFDYLERVTGYALSKLGQQVEIKVDKYGFYPKGGARGYMTISQGPVPKIKLENPSASPKIDIISIASENLQNANVAERQLKGIKQVLEIINSEIAQYVRTESTGTAITVAMRGENFIKGASALGERGKPAEKVGKEAGKSAKHLLNHQASVDNYLADQLLVLLSQAPSGSYYSIPEVTDHVKVNLEVITSILGNVIETQVRDSDYIIRRI